MRIITQKSNLFSSLKTYLRWLKNESHMLLFWKEGFQTISRWRCLYTPAWTDRHNTLEADAHFHNSDLTGKLPHSRPSSVHLLSQQRWGNKPSSYLQREIVYVSCYKVVFWTFCHLNFDFILGICARCSYQVVLISKWGKLKRNIAIKKITLV